MHFVYAMEVEKTGSITQAADNLFMSQPTLSKAIKDLEETLGFPIFRRTSRGVVPTHKGGEFLLHARKIVTQIEKMELALQIGDASGQAFSIAIPRAGYIAEAVSEFISSLDLAGDREFDILETSSMRAIDAVASSHFVLGIIRLHVEDEEYFLKSLTEKCLQYELVWESGYVAVMGKDSPLAGRQHLSARDLRLCTEAVYGDDDVPYIRVSESEPSLSLSQDRKRVLVYSRATLEDLLRTNSMAYIRTSPLSREALERSGLVQCPCKDGGRFKDLLISRSGYRFSSLDRAFLDVLYAHRDQT